MATLAYTDVASNASISTSERSLPADTTSGVPTTQTTKIKNATLILDCNAVADGDEFLLQIYEKVSGGTQRVMRSIPIVGAQPGAGVIEITGLTLGDGWDITLKKVSGTDRTIRWSIREDLGDANVLQWLGGTPDALSSGKVPTDVKLWLTGTPDALSSGKLPADIKLWLTGTPDALSSGKVPVDVKLWKTGTPNNLSGAGNVPADLEEVNASNTAASTTVPKRLAAGGEFKVKDDGGNAIAPASATTAIQTKTDQLDFSAGGLVQADVMTWKNVGVGDLGGVSGADVPAYVPDGVDVQAIDGDTAAATALKNHAINDTDPWDAAGGGTFDPEDVWNDKGHSTLTVPPTIEIPAPGDPDRAYIIIFQITDGAGRPIVVDDDEVELFLSDQDGNDYSSLLTGSGPGGGGGEFMFVGVADGIYTATVTVADDFPIANWEFDAYYKVGGTDLRRWVAPTISRPQALNANSVTDAVGALQLRPGRTLKGHARRMDALYFGDVTGLATTGTVTAMQPGGVTPEFTADQDVDAGTRDEADCTTSES